MNRIAGLLACVLLLGVWTGCRLFTLPILMWGKEPTKTITAEYPYLAEKRVAIVVRAELETLIEYPHVQWELADHVRGALDQNVAGIFVVDPRKVADYQAKTSDWDREDPAALGKRFDADRLIELVLTQYTMREPDSPHLYRGYVSAVVNVYNTDYPNSAPAYSKEVRTVHPPDGPGQWGVGEREIRQAAMEAFAEEVAGLFYDRQVKVK